MCLIEGRMQLARAARSPDRHLRRTEQWPKTTGTGTDDGYQRVPNRRPRTSPSTERRDRMTAAGRRRKAPNGTSGVLASSNHARRWAAWATPRTGVFGGRLNQWLSTLTVALRDWSSG